MPTTTADLDVDLAELLGPLLVAEVEAYLATAARQHTPAPAPARAPQTAGLPGPAWYRIAQHLQADPLQAPSPADTAPAGPWWDGYPTPAPTLTDRILRRRPTVPVTARQHLQLMDRYITAHGWTQGQLWDTDGAVCVLGAHVRVLAVGYGTPATAWQARLAIGNALGYQGAPIPVDTWNDSPGTTQTDVHTLLRTAAART
ncbi:hypothetical protein ACFVXG_20395 [Kitasatospora sp. NPDC058162]|uniref:DUF6197 family protein n=1 Tax=Kitasatospora sp. NPDC058162 TaxID=3346362 RepID=UPI0036DEEF62